MEFAEHRDYVPGDDLRHLDWNAFARSERLVVKEFESELERTVLVVTDLSASMSPLKRTLALQCSAALSWVALSGQDRLALATLGSELRYHPPVRGRGQWGRLTDWLQQARAGGRAQLNASLQTLAQRLPRSSLLIVVSDWLEEEAWLSLAFAHYRKHQVAALQLLEGQDLAPPWLGPLRLEDVETSEQRQLSLDDRSLALYAEALRDHNHQLEQNCKKRGFFYHGCRAEESPEVLILQQLVSRGWLR
jgi:uncharacterized protein (DUF58 family)